MSITPREPADFTPTRGNYTELKPFRFWCQKVLPLVYDDSLSYYELLCKVVDFLNKTMEDVETLEGDVTSLYTAYDELQTYVNEYFSTLDVQTEIDNKLDEMAENGELNALIDPLLPALISAWLNEHLTPTTPVIDNTLSISGAGADAKVTGDKFIESLNPKGIYSASLNDLEETGVYHLSNTVTDIPNDITNPRNESVIQLNGLASGGNYALQIFVSNTNKIYHRMIDYVNHNELYPWKLVDNDAITLANEVFDFSEVNNSIIYDKFFDEENIYNTFTSSKNTLLTTDGNTEVNNTYTTTDYMDVLPEYFFKFFGFYNYNLANRTPVAFCYYDENKDFVSYSVNNIPIPYGAKYARVSFPSAWEDVANGNHHLAIFLTKNSSLAPFYKHYRFNELREKYTEYNNKDGGMFIKDSTLFPYNPTHTVFEKVSENRLLKITDSVGTAENNGCIFGYLNRADFENKTLAICIDSDKETSIAGLYVTSRITSWGGARITLGGNTLIHVGRNYILTYITTDMINAMEAGGNYKSLAILLQNNNTEETTMYVGYSILDKSQFGYSEFTSNIIGIPRDRIIKYTDKLYTKIWNACGDSVTAQGLYTQDVKNKTYVTVRNYGVSSSTIAKNDTYLTNQSLVERICGLNGNTPIGTADIWTILAGLNDALYNSTVGSLVTSGNYDITTVYGALQTICEYILNLGNTNIWLCTPTKSTYDNDNTGTTVAQVRQAILDVGSYYSIPVIDLWNESKICAYNLTAHNATTSDGVHPNALGADYIGDVIASRFASLYV